MREIYTARGKVGLLSLLVTVSTAIGAAMAQDSAAPPPGFIGEKGGRGNWPAIAQSRGDLRTHTLYRPVTLPAEPMPLLIWGNGGCSDNGLAHDKFLRNIASHGYIVIALGYAWRRPPPNDPARQEKDPTDVAQMSQAMGWAAQRTADPVDELYGHINTGRIAVAGHSCGGLQAIKISADPRISTSMIFDSGVYNRPGGRSKIQVSKEDLSSLHGPIAYFTGGPTDIAHPNASDDVKRITHVPVFFGWLPVGHGGTFSAPDGGDWAEVAVHWLDWQLKGNREAGVWFLGKDCSLCLDKRWTVEQFAETKAVAFAAPPGALARCDRECLSGFISKYLDAMLSHDPSRLPRSADLKFTEDSDWAKLGEGLWKSVSGIRPFRRDILDVPHGVAASKVIVEEAGLPVLLQIRLKIVESKITEVETMTVRTQKEGALFNPDALKEPRKEMALEPAPRQIAPREELVKIANTYADGLKIGSFVAADAPFAFDAYRIENGVVTAGAGCARPGCENIRTQQIIKHPEITYRIAAVDEDLGIVLMRLDFGETTSYAPGKSLVVWEEFKIYGGAIHAVEAFMRYMPSGKGSGWE